MYGYHLSYISIVSHHFPYHISEVWQPANLSLMDPHNLKSTPGTSTCSNLCIPQVSSYTHTFTVHAHALADRVVHPRPPSSSLWL